MRNDEMLKITNKALVKCMEYKQGVTRKLDSTQLYYIDGNLRVFFTNKEDTFAKRFVLNKVIEDLKDVPRKTDHSS